MCSCVFSASNLATQGFPIERRHSSSLQSRSNVISLLLRYNARSDIESKSRLTPLHIALQRNSAAALSLLCPSLSNEFLRSATFPSGESVTEYTTKSSSLSCLEVLLHFGADPNHYSSGVPLLILCVQYLGEVDRARDLADPMPAKDGKLDLQFSRCALHGDNSDICRVFKDKCRKLATLRHFGASETDSGDTTDSVKVKFESWLQFNGLCLDHESPKATLNGVKIGNLEGSCVEALFTVCEAIRLPIEHPPPQNLTSSNRDLRNQWNDFVPLFESSNLLSVPDLSSRRNTNQKGKRNSQTFEFRRLTSVGRDTQDHEGRAYDRNRSKFLSASAVASNFEKSNKSLSKLKEEDWP